MAPNIPKLITHEKKCSLHDLPNLFLWDGEGLGNEEFAMTRSHLYWTKLEFEDKAVAPRLVEGLRSVPVKQAGQGTLGTLLVA